MNEREALNKMREKGFIFDGAKGLITKKTIDRIARDSMITPPNSGVPTVEYRQYLQRMLTLKL